MTSYIWRPVEFDDEGEPTKHGWIEKPKRTSRHHFVQGDIQPFVSPVDGSIVSSNAGLRDHNRQHGVTNDPDSLKEKTERSQHRVSDEGQRKERVAALLDSYERAQSSGYSRRTEYDE
jgi:hypothetical protein